MVQFEILSFLPAAKQSEIINALPKVNCTNGEVIFENGDTSTDVYFILEGATKSVNYGPEGEMAYFRMRKAGDFFGYYAAISGEPRTANMIAVGDTLLARMGADAFMQLVTHNPDISRYMLKLVAGLLREETKRITGMITLSAAQLVCAELAAEAERLGGIEFEILGRQEMAAKLGLTRETISRVIGNLVRSNIVRIHREKLAILDKQRLLDIATGAAL